MTMTIICSKRSSDDDFNITDNTIDEAINLTNNTIDEAVNSSLSVSRHSKGSENNDECQKTHGEYRCRTGGI
ncbi:hypothetical protein K503DRAFT_38792 [Rhizopogon vinicolor AM-OR11-026]|uniref:Uncharacterized protein n=1 Tax=Rhizopogon vinicolor AM-OR11-026 TaxID=1314800 RepID=A0A1B7MH06_9AGAM|nr:hypothetical protein K503DRAFT_38792 [Rhizopogon vinicolor AM-OR11-026]